MTDLFSLDGRVALVTGGSRGLGWAMAKAMAEKGARIVLNGRDRASLDEAAQRIGKAAETQCFDVTDEAAAEAGIAAVAARHGRLDILIANAGIQHRRKLAEFATADWQRVIDTNLTACFVLARHAAPYLMQRRQGRIIMTASIMGGLARPTIAAYVAAKGGLVGLTRALAVELGPQGVNVNAIAPGYFATEMNAALTADAEFSRFIEGRTPLGRWARPEEIGGAAVFLAGDAASYVNGHVLYVDGGLTASL